MVRLGEPDARTHRLKVYYVRLARAIRSFGAQSPRDLMRVLVVVLSLEMGKVLPLTTTAKIRIVDQPSLSHGFFAFEGKTLERPRDETFRIANLSQFDLKGLSASNYDCIDAQIRPFDSVGSSDPSKYSKNRLFGRTERDARRAWSGRAAGSSSGAMRWPVFEICDTIAERRFSIQTNFAECPLRNRQIGVPPSFMSTSVLWEIRMGSTLSLNSPEQVQPGRAGRGRGHGQGPAALPPGCPCLRGVNIGHPCYEGHRTLFLLFSYVGIPVLSGLTLLQLANQLRL